MKLVTRDASEKRRKIEKQVAAHRRRTDLCFLHIPKTGGSSLAGFAKAVESEGVAFPVIFPHGWTVHEIVDAYPDTQLCFLLRDPIERFASGFASRMRMGRPTYASPWSPTEAIAFSFFESPVAWLEALVGDDERLKSAAIFALKGVQHLRWNYQHYFEGVEAVDRIASRIRLVGRIERTDDFLRAFCAASGIDTALIARHYEKRHVGGGPRTEIPPALRARLRAAFAREYRIHDRLLRLADADQRIAASG